jgi:CxxC motif-containing protein (DUF1111 family)
MRQHNSRSVAHTLLISLFALLCFIEAPEAANTRADLLSMEAGPQLAGTATVEKAGTESFRQIAANAPMSERARFAFGKIQFNTEWDPEPGQLPDNDGLGPVFNAVACAACHINNGRGRPPLTADEAFESILVRLSVAGEDAHGGPAPLDNYGGQLQHRAVAGALAEGNAAIEWQETSGEFADGTKYSLRKPTVVFSRMQFGDLPADTMYSLRIANPVIGLGLLEAVPEQTLLNLSDPEDGNKDGISGRANRVWSGTKQQTAVGRFGWKANVATVEDQNAGAALGDMGITSTLNPEDNCREIQTDCVRSAFIDTDDVEFKKDFLDQLTRYVRLLAVPEQRNSTNTEVVQGAELFRSIGCVQCHVATLVTADSAIHAELAGQTIHPYTDLLLHDMGPGLADNRPDYLASGSEWRTPALWGIGLTKTVTGHEYYLHDGRARTLSEAILWHAGEAQTAQQTFRQLDASNRAALVAFLQSL